MGLGSGEKLVDRGDGAWRGVPGLREGDRGDSSDVGVK